jgi:hypothetical protein
MTGQEQRQQNWSIERADHGAGLSAHTRRTGDLFRSKIQPITKVLTLRST